MVIEIVELSSGRVFTESAFAQVQDLMGIPVAGVRVGVCRKGYKIRSITFVGRNGSLGVPL